MDQEQKTSRGKIGTTVFRLLIDGEWVEGDGTTIPVLDKYSLAPFADVTVASRGQVAQIVDSAHKAFRGGQLSPHERGAILDRASELVAAREDDFVRVMQAEAGFTVADARGEVMRCKETLKLSAEEARRLAGDVVPLEGAIPRDDVVVIRVDEGSVDVEDRSGRHGAKLPA